MTGQHGAGRVAFVGAVHEAVPALGVLIDSGAHLHPFPEDVNTDHGMVARCAWTACRPYNRPQVRKSAVFETPSSTRVGLADDGDGVRPALSST
jgi:hypothetical protein